MWELWVETGLSRFVIIQPDIVRDKPEPATFVFWFWEKQVYPVFIPFFPISLIA